jgi:hypothetical protein
MQITHSHLTVYIWGTHSTLLPYSIRRKCSYPRYNIHQRCRYHPLTLQDYLRCTLWHTSEVQTPHCYLTVSLTCGDTTFSNCSIHLRCWYHPLTLQYTLMCWYHTFTLQYTFHMQIWHSQLTICTHLSYRYLAATSQYTSEVQIPPSHSVRQSQCAKHLVIHNWWQCTSWGMSKPFWDFQPLWTWRVCGGYGKKILKV